MICSGTSDICFKGETFPTNSGAQISEDAMRWKSCNFLILDRSQLITVVEEYAKFGVE